MVALFLKIKNADFSYPSWFSLEVRQLLDCVLVSDPSKRLTLDELKRHPWLVEGLAHPDTPGAGGLNENESNASNATEAVEQSRREAAAAHAKAIPATATDTSSSSSSQATYNSMPLSKPIVLPEESVSTNNGHSAKRSETPPPPPTSSAVPIVPPPTTVETTLPPLILPDSSSIQAQASLSPASVAATATAVRAPADDKAPVPPAKLNESLPPQACCVIA